MIPPVLAAIIGFILAILLTFGFAMMQPRSGDPTIHDHLGEVYEKTGKLKLAVAQWERSLTEYGRSLPADADPEDIAKVQHKLDNARVKLSKLNTTTVK